MNRVGSINSDNDKWNQYPGCVGDVRVRVRVCERAQIMCCVDKHVNVDVQLFIVVPMRIMTMIQFWHSIPSIRLFDLCLAFALSSLPIPFSFSSLSLQ